jgi:hypothetical protein
MADVKPKIVITQAVDEIEMKFQRIRKCGPDETQMRPLEFTSYVSFMLHTMSGFFRPPSWIFYFILHPRAWTIVLSASRLKKDGCSLVISLLSCVQAEI